MPCLTDDWDDRRDFGIRASASTIENRHGLTIGGFEAVLCGVFTTLSRSGSLSNLLDEVDWKEAGVKRAAVIKWWEAHKEEDRRRHLRETALAKLTEEERKALGIK